MSISYKSAGVDVDKTNRLAKRIGAMTRSTHDSKVMKGVGSFGALYGPIRGYKDPVIVSSTDGVGTKLKIAFLSGKHNTVGIDLVAMSVNDLICCGASPLFFLDYIASSNVDSKVYMQVMKGIIKGCKDAECALIGGETAEMPGMYSAGEYDLVGFSVGAVERARIIKPSDVRKNDLLIGIASTGIHSNGYSLVRKVFSSRYLKDNCSVFLKPTAIYVKTVKALLKKFNSGKKRGVHGIAHITGGAFYDKLPRILPGDKDAVVYSGSWKIPKVFDLIQKKGRIAPEEMYRTFNMGVGLVIAVDPSIAKSAIDTAKRTGYKAWVIGEVVSGNSQVYID